MITRRKFLVGGTATAAVLALGPILTACDPIDVPDGYRVLWRDLFLGDTYDGTRWSRVQRTYGQANGGVGFYEASQITMKDGGGVVFTTTPSGTTVTTPGPSQGLPGWRTGGLWTRNTSKLEAAPRDAFILARVTPPPVESGLFPAVWSTAIRTPGTANGAASTGEVDGMEVFPLAEGAENRYRMQDHLRADGSTSVKTNAASEWGKLYQGWGAPLPGAASWEIADRRVPSTVAIGSAPQTFGWQMTPDGIFRWIDGVKVRGIEWDGVVAAGGPASQAWWDTIVGWDILLTFQIGRSLAAVGYPDPMASDGAQMIVHEVCVCVPE